MRIQLMTRDILFVDSSLKTLQISGKKDDKLYVQAKKHGFKMT